MLAENPANIKRRKKRVKNSMLAENPANIKTAAAPLFAQISNFAPLPSGSPQI